MIRFLLLICIVSCSNILLAQSKPEFRAVWIATVDNIDWPSKKGLPVDSQKAEFIRLLNLHQQNGMNAVIMQVRPSTDAFYPSAYEPWSEWLSGVQGKPPSPYYDPLQFMIQETHQRGMEFHAWCNPYRADFKLGKASIAPSHITRLHPDWFLDYGDKKYFDPGNKEAQAFVVEVIRDMTERYDVDAVHFGISPFGVWRNIDKDPRGSNTKAGQTNYDDLYADILLWLEKGWIDYVAPQLYWEFGHKAAPYEVLIDWWSKHTYGKHCYIGLGIYRAGSNDIWKDSTLIPRQIELLRNTPNMQGMIFFSSKSFNKNPNGWNDSLRLHYFKEPALVPEMSWLPKKK